ncbi:MAG: 3D domain-containing protein [Candidatus Peribacter sp.]|nr:3D domain-containing protein [Candidatus Peribacter sp.]
MHIKTTPLYRTRTARLPRHLKVLIAALALVAPVMAAGVSRDLPREQDFILTAYYSPLPGQCCYVKGGYRADKVLNGEGTNGADGTEVYPGMIAAPSSYAFGTVVALPGIGRFAVHDRGGAIVELDGAHRLDIWVGYGEEGLARALAFGVRRVRGTVYEVGGFQPKVKNPASRPSLRLGLERRASLATRDRTA